MVVQLNVSGRDGRGTVPDRIGIRFADRASRRRNVMDMVWSRRAFVRRPRRLGGGQPWSTCATSGMASM